MATAGVRGEQSRRLSLVTDYLYSRQKSRSIQFALVGCAACTFNTLLGMMASIRIHKDASDDLDAIWESDPEAAGEIHALLQEAKTNQAILDSLTVHHFGEGYVERYRVTKWVEQQDKGRNLWALKIWDLEDHWPRYRIVYAFHPQTHAHSVLGIFTRDFNYDEGDERTKRVLRVYERLDIPSY